MNSLELIVSEVRRLQATSPVGRKLIVSICGAPGSGKSTISEKLCRELPRSVVIPMDGYHLYRNELDAFSDPEEAHRRRGAHWTFDAAKLVSDLEHLRIHGQGNFPSFDHSVGDPVKDDIAVTEMDNIVIIEGLYLLMQIEPWSRIKSIVDLSVFIDCPVDTFRNRLIFRHMATMHLLKEQAENRVDGSDLINAKEVLKTKSYADMIVSG